MMKTALVTGGNRGIGLAIAKGLANKGYHVLIGSRNLKAGQEATASIGENAIAVELNLSNPAQLAEHVKEIKLTHARIDVLVNNAGVLEYGDLLSISEEQLNASLNVNFKAPIQLIRSLAPAMKQNNYGRIVNVSSGWGSFNEGLNGPPAYAITKSALNALTLSVSRELPATIKVNAMCPGWVRTRMGGVGAARSPEEGAETAIWLATLPENGPTGGFFRDKELIGW